MNAIRWFPLYAVLIGVGVYFLKRYMNGCTCETVNRLDGKIVIVTGANTGIGRETTAELLRRGAHVYMACRSVEKAQQAADEILEQVDNVSLSHSLSIMHLDLSSLDSIRQFAKDFHARESRLDILINNAGVMLVPESTTVDGYETTFATNHLGPFLLTHLLIDLLLIAGNSSGDSRIITVSARAHEFGTMMLDNLMMTGNYNRITAYAQSKLANVLFTHELAIRLKGTAVSAYSLHPGVIRTELTRHVFLITDFSIGRALSFVVSWPFVKEPWHGAQTTIYLATANSLASGKYYSDCAEVLPTAEAYNDSVSTRLWQLSEQFVRLDQQEIHQVLQSRRV